MAHGGRVYYYDTDSLATDIPLPADMVDDNEYGKWKDEGAIEEAVYLFPKVYCERKTTGEEKKTNVKMKGVPKSQTPAALDWYLQTLEELRLYQREEKTTAKEVYRDDERYKIMTALKGKIEFARPRAVHKALILNGPTKRTMDYLANDSRPLWVDVPILEVETDASGA